MKKLFLSMILGAMVLLSACTSPVADELITYQNEEIAVTYVNLMEEAEEVFVAYEQMAGMENFEEAEVYMEEEVLPVSEELQAFLSNIELEQEEVQAVNQTLIEAHDTLHEALEMDYESFQLINGGQVDQGLEMAYQSQGVFEEAEQLLMDFEEERDTLMEEHDVELEEVDEG
ncbi:hypothetical protein HUG15_20020 [Salicibibacter cibarius]|uniref:Lipoprotein n=1 Tax=Salicibibacter cibarius TaxID=2743000 RepID=A0A7T6Z6E4_9BACI|nr:hypothetical protein [Salicibibacter cibarius]QQK77646.1 hypothetical protein HUG15_20020 [Salicibibacter cibarius]